ncbi:hypothetical protein GCM10022223_21800 [Kineosporia mesophila]|uniref:Uncharacterized protein n=1 Tax=Kineosporia mesophila TaxID=566012 RepID=A0ABP6ZGR6_9ACTN
MEVGEHPEEGIDRLTARPLPRRLTGEHESLCEPVTRCHRPRIPHGPDPARATPSGRGRSAPPAPPSHGLITGKT